MFVDVVSESTMKLLAACIAVFSIVGLVYCADSTVPDLTVTNLFTTGKEIMIYFSKTVLADTLHRDKKVLKFSSVSAVYHVIGIMLPRQLII